MFNIDSLTEAVKGTTCAFRSRNELQPAGGPGDKVFPPTFADAAYATEQRRLPGRSEPVECVLLDSVQSQANRMEEALQDAVDEGRLKLPMVEVDFTDEELLAEVGKVTSLTAPHRVADAILRDSLLDGTPFRQTEIGSYLDSCSLANATPLFNLCPTALLFGIWDSTGPKGGMGFKFQRVMVSEIVGIDAVFGVKTSSRIDPLQIMLKAGPLYQARDKDGVWWTLDPSEAPKSKGAPLKLKKTGRPSEANHGNIVPSISKRDRDGRPLAGGVTIASAEQTVTLSLPAIRRLKFPVDGKVDAETNTAGRTVIAALGLCAAALASEKGFDLRSRCLLWPAAPMEWENLGHPGSDAEKFTLDAAAAIELLNTAVERAEELGLEWYKEPLVLKPAPQLAELVKRSQELAAAGEAEEDE